MNLSNNAAATTVYLLIKDDTHSADWP